MVKLMRHFLTKLNLPGVVFFAQSAPRLYSTEHSLQ